MSLFGVVTMDIIGSRKLKNRIQVQEKLSKYIEIMNKKYYNILTAPICFTLGDEWQFIINEPYQCYNLIHEFQQLLWKEDIDFYAGIGIGALNTEIYDDTRKMDGPCFNMARQAINIAKNNKNKDKYIFSKHNRVYFLSYESYSKNNENLFLNYFKQNHNMNNIEEVAITSANDLSNNCKMYETITFENIINTLIENNEILKARLTQKQKKTYVDYIEWGSYRKILEMNSEDIKESIGGISQRLNNAEYFTIQRNHDLVSNMLKYYCMLRRDDFGH